jgi:hypothetical protein
MATIFSGTLTSDDSGAEDYSYRQRVPITGDAQDQVRVTFRASSAAAWSVDNASIGIATTDGSTASTPVELLFGGASGFAISAGADITSDWLTFAGFISTDELVVIMDHASANGNCRRNAAGAG